MQLSYNNHGSVAAHQSDGPLTLPEHSLFQHMQALASGLASGTLIAKGLQQGSFVYAYMSPALQETALWH